MKLYHLKFRILVIVVTIALCITILAFGALKDVKNDRRDQLIGRYIDLSLVHDAQNNPLLLNQKTIIHVHADFCPSCIKDKKLFDSINLKGKVPLIGLKWINMNQNSSISPLNDNVYTAIVNASSTDFFVKLGMTTVPLTIIVGIDGQILYSHLGMLEQSEIDNAIIPIIHAK